MPSPKGVLPVAFQKKLGKLVQGHMGGARANRDPEILKKGEGGLNNELSHTFFLLGQFPHSNAPPPPQLLLAAGCQPLDATYWLLAAGCWLLPTGCWLLAAGCWLLAAGCWLLAAGCWLLAAGCWLLAAGCWLLAAGCWLLAASC